MRIITDILLLIVVGVVVFAVAWVADSVEE